MILSTIGGYGFTEKSFIGRLREANVDTLVDVRRRRGMRGAKYAFLNSSYLQAALADAGISYYHALELAPTPSTRDIQKSIDREYQTSKNERTLLSPAFVKSYEADLSTNFSVRDFERTLAKSNKAALFCVECAPLACHRSIAARLISWQICGGHAVEHLMP